VPNAPHADQLRLLDVADLDARYQQLVHAKKTHPTVAHLVDLDKHMADLHGSLVTSRTAVSDIRRELARTETAVEQVVARLSRNRERLASGAVSHKDAVALTDEIESLARRQGVLEEEQLEVMERLDSHQTALEQVEAAHRELADDKLSTSNEQERAFADLAHQAKALVAERTTILSGLQPALVAQYESIRKRLGSGASVLRAGRCTGCGMELSPTDLAAAKAAPEDAIVYCEECGRILVRDTDAIAAA
jgi:predicted  nucleic acid-binding Zn-ribbon protein